MLTYDLDRRGGLSLYEYLYRCIRRDILSGTLAAGERLPSKRRLAEHLHLSVMTVEGAYRQLEAEGYLYTRPRQGFFVSPVEPALPVPSAPPLPEEPSPSWRLDLASSQADGGRFPVSTWARLTRQVLSEGRTFLDPVPPQGLPALREAIAESLRTGKGMAVSPGQIVVGAGAEYLYLLLAQLLGRDTVLAVEDPGYSKIRQIYGKWGLTCRPVPLDRQGMDPAALAASGAGAAHLSPSHHYPTGIVTPIARRQSLLRWRPSPPPCAWAFWCCRRPWRTGTAGSWASTPARCPPWSSTCWPGSSPAGFTTGTCPGCARSTVPVGPRCWRPSAPASPQGTWRTGGRGSTSCCGWTLPAPTRPFWPGRRRWGYTCGSSPPARRCRSTGRPTCWW